MNEKFLRIVLAGIGAIALLMFVLKMVDFVRNKADYQDTLTSAELTDMRRDFRDSDERAPSGSHLEEYSAYTVIHELNITGYEPPPPTIETPTETVKQGVRASDFAVPFIQFPSAAWIQPAGAQTEPNSETLPGDLYIVGQEFELKTRRGTKLRLEHVEVDKVTIVVVETGEEIIVRTGDLPLNEKELAGTGMTGIGGAADPQSVISRPPPDRTVKDDAGVYRVGTSDVDDLSDMTQEELLASATVRPHRDKLTNEVIGLTLSRINSPLLLRMGLEQGDIVLDVNGEPALSRDDLVNKMRDFQGNTITVRIERLGGERTLTYRLPR